MSHTISERDWKVFRELHEVALQRLCDKILAEAKVTIEQTGNTSHQKYLRLYKLLLRRDHDLARGFNDLRRSTAFTQIGIIHSMGLFKGEELRRFSPETIQVIELYGSIPDDS